MKKSLGNYFKEKRLSMNYSLRKLAKEANISVTYLSDIETGKSTNISKEIIDKICKALQLTENDIETAYSLLGNNTNSIPRDVEEFIKNHPFLVPYLREAKKGKHEDWLKGVKKDNES